MKFREFKYLSISTLANREVLSFSHIKERHQKWYKYLHNTHTYKQCITFEFTYFYLKVSKYSNKFKPNLFFVPNVDNVLNN